MKSIRLGAGREFDLIRRFTEQDAAAIPPGVVVGPGDDCAVVAGRDVVVGTDLSVEGVHFRREWMSAEEIGYRAAAAALSDLAAMAARPIGVLVSLMLPPADAAAGSSTGDATSGRGSAAGSPTGHATGGRGSPAGGGPTYADRVMAGARSAIHDVGAALIGGDVTRSPGPLALDVVVLGEVARPVLRSGGRPGDELWVTGPLGGAAAAVAAWTAGGEPSPETRAAFVRPRPRVAEARWLAERGIARAMIDLSDGLAGDADHIAAASGVCAEIDAAAVPLHSALARGGWSGERALRLALGGGEDYELLFAAPAGLFGPQAGEFEALAGGPASQVGRLAAGVGVRLRHPDGMVEPLDRGGYDHFAGDDE